MKLRLDKFTKRFGDLTVIEDMDLTVESGEMMALLGPSGCGKSTTLFAVCGIHKMNGGKLYFGGKDVTTLPAQERSVGVVFQNYALYPHMTVQENMGFGLRMNGYPKAEIAEKVAEASRILKLDDYLRRKPAALSGGQRQRVSIGRAIVRGPEVFLFDEPLSNLDAELRVEMRVEIARLHKEIGATMIYVTHDQVEAMTLADKIVVLRAGVIEQVGAPMDLYRNPDNKFVAGFIGSPAMNFLSAKVCKGVVDVPGLQASVKMDVTLPAEGTAVELGLRPEHLAIDPKKDTHCIEMTESLGGVSYAYLMGASGEKIVVEERGDLRSQEGATVGLKVDALSARLFDAITEARIR